MLVFMLPFSASRLKVPFLLFKPFFDFFDFVGVVDPNKLLLIPALLGLDLLLLAAAPGVGEGAAERLADGSASSPSSSSNGSRSVSFRTLDLSWVTTCFRFGSSFVMSALRLLKGRY